MTEQLIRAEDVTVGIVVIHDGTAREVSDVIKSGSPDHRNCSGGATVGLELVGGGLLSFAARYLLKTSAPASGAAARPPGLR